LDRSKLVDERKLHRPGKESLQVQKNVQEGGNTKKGPSENRVAGGGKRRVTKGRLEWKKKSHIGAGGDREGREKEKNAYKK